MDFTPETTVLLTTAFGVATLLARGFEYLAKVIYALIVGKKDPIVEMQDMLSKATNNHLTHIQASQENLVALSNKSLAQHEMMLEQGRQQFAQHEKELELLSGIKGVLSK